MIDRTARDRLAEALRQLAAGTITNFEYEDRADAAMTSTQHKQKDPALWAVRSRSWFCYTDIRTQRFRGQEKLSKESRHEIARWVLFLKSDAEYLWPIKSFITLSGCILQILTLGLARYFLRSRYERIGPWAIWPFWAQEQLSQVLARPVYLAGKQVPPPLHDKITEPRWR